MKPSTIDNDSFAGYVDWKGWAKEDFGKCDPRVARYFAWHVGRALGRTDAAPRVLEIGFGNGAFLGHCRDRGWLIAGVEQDPMLVQRAREWGIEAGVSIEDLPQGEVYDLIAMFDVLEHIPTDDLVAFLKALVKRLAPDGALLVRVPNGDSPFGLRHQHGDVTHVTAFGEFKLRQLASLTGLKLLTMGEAPWHSQQGARRDFAALCRGIARHCINRIVSFAYFNRNVDLASNLVVVLVPASSSRVSTL